jgi:hypothetical protein
MRRRITLVLTLALTLSASVALAACGTSKADKAKAQVCTARDDIRKQVTELQNITAGTPTPKALKGALDAVGKDLKKIKDAQPDLKGDRQAAVKKAKAQFESDLTQIIASFSKDFSITSARARLIKVSTSVALAYQTALEPIDCG